MKRLLLLLVPVVLVGGIVVAAFVTQSGGDARAAAGLDIRQAVERGAPAERVGPRINDYVSQYGQSADARWFASESYLAIGMPKMAARVVTAPAAMRGDPETAPRFARLYLGMRSHPSPTRPQGDVRALLALADAGVEEVRTALLARVQRDPDVGWALEASLMLERAGSPFLGAFQEALRSRGTPEAALAAAVTGADEVHPGDLALLRSAAEGKGPALPQPILFAVATALGASGDAGARAFLEARWQAAGRDMSDPTSLPWLAGLAASGNAEALGTLGEKAGGWGGSPAAPFLMDPIIRRVVKGDPAGVRAALAAWGTIPSPAARWLFAAGVYLSMRLPDLPVDSDPLLRAIESTDDPALEAVAAARRLRLGDEQAAERLMKFFLTLRDNGEPVAGSAFSEALLVSATALAVRRSRGPR